MCLILLSCSPPPQVIKLWWGYLRLEASGTELHAHVISDRDDSLMDEFTLTKPADWGQQYMQQQQQQQLQDEEVVVEQQQQGHNVQQLVVE